MNNVWKIEPMNSRWMNSRWMDSDSWLGYSSRSRSVPPRSIYINKKKKNARKAQRKARKRNR